jgi:hypothetical protein
MVAGNPHLILDTGTCGYCFFYYCPYSYYREPSSERRRLTASLKGQMRTGKRFNHQS